MLPNDRVLSGNSGPAHALFFLPGHVLFLFVCILISSKGSAFQQEVHWDKRALGIRHPFNL